MLQAKLIDYEHLHFFNKGYFLFSYDKIVYNTCTLYDFFFLINLQRRWGKKNLIFS